MVQTFNSGDVLEHPQLNNMIRAMGGDGVISGFAVTQRAAGGANMSVDVALGEAKIDNTIESEAVLVNVVIAASHATLERKDLITYDASANTPAVIKGTDHAGTAGDPTYPPDLPAGDILLAMVKVDANTSTIVDGDITDCRIFIDEGSAWQYSGASEFSGNAPTSWTDLNLASTVGTNRAVAILKVKQTGALDQTFAFRPNGDTDEYYRALITGEFSTPTNFELDEDQATLVTVITDASGIIEWKAETAVSTTIHVLAWSRLLV